jgi:hypothetical protein
MENLKQCPFCGGNPELIVDYQRSGYGEYERNLEFHVVQCKNCSSKGRQFEQKPLCDFTAFTVAEFRSNPALRAKVEDEYNLYAEQTKELAVNAWNRRI